MARDALDTKRTARNKLGCIIAGNLQRTSSVQAAISALISASGITSVSADTFGFLANTTFSDSCVATASGTTLTSSENPFSSADVGKTIHVAGAGAAGATHTTTIATFTNSGSIEMTDAAVTTTTADASSATGLAVWGDLINLLMDDPGYRNTGNSKDERHASGFSANSLGALSSASTVIAADTVLTASQALVIIDTTGGTVTATLPASPANGQRYDIKLKKPGANNATIARNGNTIDRIAADLTLSVDSESNTLQFVTGYGWAVL